MGSATVSVVMPVFNAQPYLAEAIESILDQSHRDLRLAIYDDHSTDGSYELACRYRDRDDRVTVRRGTTRLGPSRSSQCAADLASSDIVARMDADDVAHPQRIARQLQGLRAHPDAVLVGSLFDMIDGRGRTIRRALTSRVAARMPPFGHSSIMYRREAFDRCGGYAVATDYFEDADLYRRLAAVGGLMVIAAPLMRVRFQGQNARLRDRVELVAARLSTFPSPAGGADAAGLSPLALYAIASLSVFARRRPHLLALMTRRGSFRPLVPALRVWLFLLCADISPTLTRGAVNAGAIVRDALSPRRFRRGGLYPWRFPVD